MAYTRIHAIKQTLGKALAYIENPEKTDDLLLVSGYNVDPLTASIEYEMTAALAKEIVGDYSATGGGNNLAYHMIQSFAKDDDITPEQAHDIGKKWADEILKGQYEYVISTHLDKGHLHNHIIFNATSFYNYKKYETVPYKTARLLRNISDKLCAENGLSVIKENPNRPKAKGKTHYQWEQHKKGISFEARLKEIIDTAIKEAKTYEQFKEILLSNNVEIKNAEEKDGKHIGYRLNGEKQKKFTRGYSIGDDYTRDRIKERIEKPKEIEVTKTEQQAPSIDTFDKKVQWQARQTRLAETKELAAALLTIRRESIESESDFDIRIEELTKQAAGVRVTITDIDNKNLQYKDAAKYLVTYNKYLPIKQEYDGKSTLTRKSFATRYESELLAFDHASTKLQQLGVNTNVSPDKVITLVKEQDKKVTELKGALSEVTDRLGQLRAAEKIVQEVYQDKEAEQKKTKSRDQEREG